MWEKCLLYVKIKLCHSALTNVLFFFFKRNHRALLFKSNLILQHLKIISKMLCSYRSLTFQRSRVFNKPFRNATVFLNVVSTNYETEAAVGQEM